jgi:anaerobic selenocysteine-containing dehydrogenase
VAEIAYRTCCLCEAVCGIAVEHEPETGRVLRVRGDEQDPLSRGYICPKAAGLDDVRTDPDRLRQPLLRTESGHREIGWDQALDLVAARLHAIQAENGRDAVAVYVGNPIAHSYGAMLFGLAFLKALGTRNYFSSQSVDALPRILVSHLLYGNPAAIPVPDLDRTELLLVLGANPVVSNGSAMTAPGMKHRLEAIRARGGKLVVVDPRRSETAQIADLHLAIRPGTDALLLLALLATIFEERLADPGSGPLGPKLSGLEELQRIARAYPPERVASPVGIEPGAIRELARSFARARAAVCYGRLGTTIQDFGTLASWLIDALNIVTGNFDRPGGAMFARAAIDLPRLVRRLGLAGGFDRWRSRVSGLPEFNGELPVAALREEIETPGPGRIRALLTFAGNPVLSLPSGRRLGRALDGLEFMVSIDPYLNETTRRAHLVLPPTFGLERDHYPLLHHALAVRNTAKYAPALFTPPPGVRPEWWITNQLLARLLRLRGPLNGLAGSAFRAAGARLEPRGLLRLMLGLERRVSLRTLEANPHGIDLGPLEPRLFEVATLPGGRLELVPERLATDLARLEERLSASGDAPALLLIGRRQVRSNNSWMHNSLRLVKGKNRCTLLMHPTDAAARGLAGGQRVRIAASGGAVDAELEVSAEMMPGVVSLPHGWGHDDDGARLGVARARPGVSVNDIIDDARVDRASGASSVNGVPVEVSAV